MRKLVLLLLLTAVVIGVLKALESKKRYFMEGSEEELRERVRSKFEDRVSGEKLAEIESKVVDFARKKGTLVGSA